MQNRSARFPVELAPILGERGPAWRLDRYTESSPRVRSLHLHDAFELGLCLSGAGQFVVETKVYPYRAGDAVVLHSLEAHRAQSARGASRWWFAYFNLPRLLAPLHPSPELLQARRFRGPRFRNLYRAEDGGKIRDRVAALIEEIGAKRPHQADMVPAMLVQLLAALLRANPRTAETGSGRSLQALTRLKPALDRVATGYAGPLEIPALAAACGMGLSSFRREFTLALGVAPQRYLIDHRLARAKALIASGQRNIAEAAFACGFESLSSFNRHFKTREGKAPRQWRGPRSR